MYNLIYIKVCDIYSKILNIHICIFINIHICIHFSWKKLEINDNEKKKNENTKLNIDIEWRNNKFIYHVLLKNDDSRSIWIEPLWNLFSLIF